jgi:ribosomal protein S18 acetylase RimI-like enzyme
MTMTEHRAQLVIRPAVPADDDAIWRVLEPTLRAGETYPVAPDCTRAQALAYWHNPANTIYVAEDAGEIVGTYYLRANTGGPGAHVANCGYMVLPEATGRGVGRSMCLHSLERARERSFRAMQFNLVISTNERALKLWQSCGFAIVGRLPGAFAHPTKGFVDAFVMFQKL